MYYPNPYDVLNVSKESSNKEITRAFGMAMKRKQYSMEVIAQARKTLMNEEERILADYLQPIIPSIQRFKHSDLSELVNPTPTLEIIPELTDSTTDISHIKQKLGSTLFSEK